MGNVVEIDCEKSIKLETSPTLTKSKRRLHWCRSISKQISVQVLLQYQSKSYYITGQEVYYSIGRFYYIIGQLLHYRAFFYYIIGHVLQYRAFITLSVGTLPSRNPAPATMQYHRGSSVRSKMSCSVITSKFFQPRQLAPRCSSSCPAPGQVGEFVYFF